MPPRIARSPSLPMLLLPLALTAACLPMAAYAADASTDQVYAAAKAGDVPGALTMMDQVLKDHPNSAKAHYVEAELLSRAHRAADARVELAKAQQLDPSGRFANARSQAQLRAALGAGGGAAGAVAPAPAPQGSHISFGMILFGALAIRTPTPTRIWAAMISACPAAAGMMAALAAAVMAAGKGLK